MVIPSPVAGVVSARNRPGFWFSPEARRASRSAIIPKCGSTPMSRSPMRRQWRSARRCWPAWRPIPTRIAGKVTWVGQTLDPATHRMLVRSQIKDPDRLLRAGMLATFTITTEQPVQSVGIPEWHRSHGDGTMTVWIAKSSTHFERRVVTIDGRMAMPRFSTALRLANRSSSTALSSWTISSTPVPRTDRHPPLQSRLRGSFI